MELSLKQTEALDILEDGSTVELLYGGGAGGGKSILGCYWTLKSCLRYEGSRYLIARSQLKTLKETTLKSFWTLVKLQGLPRSMFCYKPAEAVIQVLPTGSEIVLRQLFSKPSDPDFDELGSLEITGAFVDECNQISERAWNVLRSRIRYRLDDFSLIPKLLGTCNPSKGFVYSRFYKPALEGELPEERRFVESLVGDNPYISKHYRASLANLDEKSRQRLLFGSWDFDQDPAQLIPYEAILDMFSNTTLEKGERYITADIARFGCDSTVVALWSGLRMDRLVRLQKSSTTETAAFISDFAGSNGVRLSNIICDEDGVGGGVVDILKCRGFVNNSRAIAVHGKRQNFQNLKAQCYFKLAELICGYKIYVNESSPEIRAMLIEELEQVRALDISGDAALGIIPKSRIKEIIGRSPDISDALAMRMFFELSAVGKAAPKVSGLFY